MAVSRKGSKRRISVQPVWIDLGLAAAAALAVAAGLFEPGAVGPGLRLALAAVVLVAGGRVSLRRIRGMEPETFAESIEGPLLWCAGAWVLYRTAQFYAGQAVLIPAAFTAFLVATYPLKIVALPVVEILVMEGGLALTGFQSMETMALNLLCYALAVAGFTFFTSGKVYRRRMRTVYTRAKRKAAAQEYAEDLGLHDPGVSLLDTLPRPEALAGRDVVDSQPAVETIASSFDLQLELIRQALQVTTVAVLWPDAEGRELRLRNIATGRQDIVPGPYAAGTGITGALTGRQHEVAVCPVQASYAGLPYYKKPGGVGSILALKIAVDGGHHVHGDRPVEPILCADRAEPAAWTEQERGVFRLAARRLGQDVAMGRSFLAMDQERGAVQRVCIGLRELNAVLGLEQALAATVKAVKVLIKADFIAISVVQDGCHRIAQADGSKAKNLQGREFPLDAGLVGQVLKLKRSLPAKAECYGPTAIFSNDELISGFRSLLIVPLTKEDGGAIGALTVALREPAAFTRLRQEILQLIAAQVAIKIDLGQAHEQISRMATTDGLTELANHRTFQHGFDMILKRAERRGSPVCLILCDIDHFKNINDSYGHPFGDLVLKKVAGVLKGAVRAVDLPARYGGEEFAIVLEDSGRAGALKMAERIRLEIERLAIRHEKELVRLTMSLGLAVFPEDGEEKAQLISRADQALYQAKQSGRNRTVAWSGAGPPGGTV